MLINFSFSNDGDDDRVTVESVSDKVHHKPLSSFFSICVRTNNVNYLSAGAIRNGFNEYKDMSEGQRMAFWFLALMSPPMPLAMSDRAAELKHRFDYCRRTLPGLIEFEFESDDNALETVYEKLTRYIDIDREVDVEVAHEDDDARPERSEIDEIVEKVNNETVSEDVLRNNAQAWLKRLDSVDAKTDEMRNAINRLTAWYLFGMYFSGPGITEEQKALLVSFFDRPEFDILVNADLLRNNFAAFQFSEKLKAEKERLSEKITSRITLGEYESTFKEYETEKVNLGTPLVLPSWNAYETEFTRLTLAYGDEAEKRRQRNEVAQTLETIDATWEPENDYVDTNLELLQGDSRNYEKEIDFLNKVKTVSEQIATIKKTFDEELTNDDQAPNHYRGLWQKWERNEFNVNNVDGSRENEQQWIKAQHTQYDKLKAQLIFLLKTKELIQDLKQFIEDDERSPDVLTEYGSRRTNLQRQYDDFDTDFKAKINAVWTTLNTQWRRADEFRSPVGDDVIEFDNLFEFVPFTDKEVPGKGFSIRENDALFTKRFFADLAKSAVVAIVYGNIDRLPNSLPDDTRGTLVTDYLSGIYASGDSYAPRLSYEVADNLFKLFWEDNMSSWETIYFNYLIPMFLFLSIGSIVLLDESEEQTDREYLRQQRLLLVEYGAFFRNATRGCGELTFNYTDNTNSAKESKMFVYPFLLTVRTKTLKKHSLAAVIQCIENIGETNNKDVGTTQYEFINTIARYLFDTLQNSENKFQNWKVENHQYSLLCEQHKKAFRNAFTQTRGSITVDVTSDANDAPYGCVVHYSDVRQQTIDKLSLVQIVANWKNKDQQAHFLFGENNVLRALLNTDENFAYFDELKVDGTSVVTPSTFSFNDCLRRAQIASQSQNAAAIAECVSAFEALGYFDDASDDDARHLYDTLHASTGH